MEVFRNTTQTHYFLLRHPGKKKKFGKSSSSLRKISRCMKVLCSYVSLSYRSGRKYVLHLSDECILMRNVINTGRVVYRYGLKGQPFVNHNLGYSLPVFRFIPLSKGFCYSELSL
uniref:Uncharacterized protein n=1 Tax=Xiphophorus couchianus TaxID=32473 RepID=A0A3B5M4X4_9TELE